MSVGRCAASRSSFTAACACSKSLAVGSIYEVASATQTGGYKRVLVPLPAGTPFFVSQGAFGRHTHSPPGGEYLWDLDVPYGTPVVSVSAGRVLWATTNDSPGGCDARWSDAAWSVGVGDELDGTVANYVHVLPQVKRGDLVRRAQVVAVTAQNGFICTPQLHFGVYSSVDAVPGSARVKTLPLAFEGIDGHILREGRRYQSPSQPSP